jgi:glycosyltransferase involved in cell wall biosynthesis
MLNEPMSELTLRQLYSDDRSWRIIETCHNTWFDANNNKRYNPDGYIFCTPWHKENTYSTLSSPNTTIEFPIENKVPTTEQKEETKKLLGFDLDKINVVNVGLWTRGKNQGEMVEVAKLLEKTNPEIIFHFIGNQAVNFQDYWEPIMSDIPSNVRIWGERNDVELFLTAADLMMFNSTLECNPLVVKESISHGLKIIARPLDQYMGIYDDYIFPIKNNNVNDIKDILLNSINSENIYSNISVSEGYFSKKHMEFYKKVLLDKPMNQIKKQNNIQIIHHFVENPFIEIRGESNSNYTIKVYD